MFRTNLAHAFQWAIDHKKNLRFVLELLNKIQRFDMHLFDECYKTLRLKENVEIWHIYKNSQLLRASASSTSKIPQEVCNNILSFSFGDSENFPLSNKAIDKLDSYIKSCVDQKLKLKTSGNRIMIT